MSEKIGRNHKKLSYTQKCLPISHTASFDVHRYFVAQQLTMSGFSVWDHTDKWMARIQQIASLLRSGSVRNHQTMLEGFEKCPDALKALLRGEYRGRVVVKV